jgi:hypothetical protein
MEHTTVKKKDVKKVEANNYGILHVYLSMVLWMLTLYNLVGVYKYFKVNFSTFDTEMN